MTQEQYRKAQPIVQEIYSLNKSLAIVDQYLDSPNVGKPTEVNLSGFIGMTLTVDEETSIEIANILLKSYEARLAKLSEELENI